LQLVPVTTATPLFDGIVISEPLRFDKADAAEDTWEQCLSIDTPEGLVVVVGCSHPGILPMLEQVKRQTGRPLYLVIGGFHLLGHRPTEVRRVATAMQALGVAHVSATHCTGTVASHIFHTVFGDRYIDAGVGTVISLPFVARSP
jgi:7,8-dihydropterin-6-yl-methyl-4-(beta-D-ribofuranosyl)aminobenzene 5'-phosphate synthase